MNNTELFENLWSFEEISKNGGEHDKWLAIGSNGKEYQATFTREYDKNGTMFFCIHYSVEILGYLKII